LLSITLAKFGYEPVVENNLLLAINTARHHLPDLILLDVMMSERDCERVLADLYADLLFRYISVILLTAIAREMQGLANTGDINIVILAKPVQLRELLRTIGSELAEDRNYNEQVEFDSAQQVAMGEDTAVGPAMELPASGEGTAGDASGSAFSGDATTAVDFAFPQRESDAESEQDRLDR
jgi:CheY-like chemotaxis protein